MSLGRLESAALLVFSLVREDAEGKTSGSASELSSFSSEGSLCENTQTIVSFPINKSKRASIGLEVYAQNRSISGGNILSSILGSPVQLRNEDIW